ncbi:MAG TPA: HAD-IA family hydrolase [Gemmatimonadales bacterium]
MPAPLKAVLFDAGNTLLYLDYERIAAAVGAVLGLALDPGRLVAASSAASRAAGRAQGPDRVRSRAYLEALFTGAGVPPERWDDVAACLHRLHQENSLWCRLAAGTREALDRLRSAGLRLGVVSNADGRVEEALVAAGLRDCFDVVLDSALAGVEKPDPAIFRAALDALGVTAAEALYVGDLYEVDVVGARAAGMEAVLLLADAPEAGADCGCYHSLAALADDLLKRGRS